jgi:hypothetical protein
MKHANKRLIQRIGNTDPMKLSIKARKLGFDVSSFTGSLRRYLDHIRTKDKHKYIRVYKHKLFIFMNVGDYFVTVMNIPQKHMKSLINQIEKIGGYRDV